MRATNKSDSAVAALAMTPSAETFGTLQGTKLAATNDVETSTIAQGAARIAVVDGDDRVRETFSFQLGTAGFRVDSYSCAEEFLTSKDANNFDCIVAGILLPRMNGLDLQEHLKEAGDFVSIVFVTECSDLSILVHAIRAGAVDVLEKPVNDEVLLAAIERGVLRTRFERLEQVRRLDIEHRFKSLPARQREVFALITAGFLNKQVGAKLGISERTVKVHRERLRRKMGVDSLAELSRIAGFLENSRTSSARPS